MTISRKGRFKKKRDLYIFAINLAAPEKKRETPKDAEPWERELGPLRKPLPALHSRSPRRREWYDTNVNGVEAKKRSAKLQRKDVKRPRKLDGRRKVSEVSETETG